MWILRCSCSSVFYFQSAMFKGAQHAWHRDSAESIHRTMRIPSNKYTSSNDLHAWFKMVYKPVAFTGVVDSRLYRAATYACFDVEAPGRNCSSNALSCISDDTCDGCVIAGKIGAPSRD